MLKNLFIIYGSDSSEWEISVRSGEFTASNFDGTRYNVFEVFARFGKWKLLALREGTGPRVKIDESIDIQIDKTDCSLMLPACPEYGISGRIRPDFVYIMQHGTPGENGLMQGYLQMLGIPHSSCSAFVAAVTFDKYSCKSYLRDKPYVKCAKDIFVRKGQDVDPKEWVKTLGLPMFVKPTDGGSSFGVTKVKKEEDILPALKAAFAESDSVIAESAIKGRELTCAAYRSKDGVRALPIIEIVPHTEWFDYEAKYNGLSDEICPAQVPAYVWDMIQRSTQKIYEQLGCEGLVRVDYILSEDGLYFLEVNIVPGMTSASLVPQMVREAGLEMKDFLNEVIDSKCC